MKHIKLMNYLKELAAEEEGLKEALASIQEQLNVLEVEQLHILGLMRKAEENTVQTESNLQESTNESDPKPLILDIDCEIKKYTNDEEMDEESENEEL